MDIQIKVPTKNQDEKLIRAILGTENCQIELNRKWLYDTDHNTIGETNFVISEIYAKNIFKELNDNNKFVQKYDNFEEFTDTYEPETDGELIYQSALRDNKIIEDIGENLYNE